MSGRQIPPDVQQALKELRDYLAKVYGERLRGVYLYGSYARGDFHADSDVDVLIVLEGTVRPGQEIDRIGDGVADICLEHSMLIATYPVPEEWLKERKSPLFENVRREGVRL
ncbi:MAG: nucleotidyltransferase domain-containing protein [Thermodesulfobacteriota bacterium]